MALSRGSPGDFPVAAVLPTLPWDQSLHQTRGDSPPIEYETIMNPVALAAGGPNCHLNVRQPLTIDALRDASTMCGFALTIAGVMLSAAVTDLPDPVARRLLAGVRYGGIAVALRGLVL